MDEKDSFHASDRADISYAASFLRHTGRQDDNTASRSQTSAHIRRTLDVERFRRAGRSVKGMPHLSGL